MATVKTFQASVWWLVVFIIIAIFAAEYTVQARLCRPPCKDEERCVSLNHHDQWLHFNNICVPERCFFRPRRGRCRHFRHPYHFHPGLKKCTRDYTGACYGRRNRFKTMEDCELTCLHRKRE